MKLRNIYKTFESLIPPFDETVPQTPPNDIWAFIAYFIKPHWWVFALVALFSAAHASVELWLFRFLGTLVDQLATRKPEEFLAELGHHVWLIALLAFALPSLTFVFSLLKHQGVYGNFPLSLRWYFHRYLLMQSVRFYQDEFAGRIATKVMQSALAVRDIAMKCADSFVYIGVYFVGMVVLAASIDGVLMLPFLLWLIGYGFIVRYFLPKFTQIAKVQADKRSDMTGRVTDAYSHINTVKLFAHAQREAAFARVGMEGFAKPVYAQMRLATLYDTTLSLHNALLLFGSVSLALYLWVKGESGGGAVAVCLALALRIEGMSQWVGWELNALFENIGTTIDGVELIAQPLSVTDAPQASELVVSTGDIAFKQLRFSYDAQRNVFDGFDLHVRGGEKIGLIGASGAGKSTLLNLLLRLYDVDGGQIDIDGQNIASVTQRSLRQQIGMVTQDTSLLHRSVYDNLIYGRPEASAAEVEKAAERAEASEFIAQLHDAEGRVGYDAHVGERGVKLSGGQRQRMAIARVLLKDAPILLLDEATSALDSEVEAAINQTLEPLMQGKTVIAIAHRLSTIAKMDRLVVIENGKILEVGDHHQLLALGGYYAKLWHRQSGGFLS